MYIHQYLHTFHYCKHIQKRTLLRGRKVQNHFKKGLFYVENVHDSEKRTLLRGKPFTLFQKGLFYVDRIIIHFANYSLCSI